MSFCDKYVEQNRPWELAKLDEEKLRSVLYVLLECLRHCALMIAPIMPSTSDTILESLGLDPAEVKEQSIDTLKQWGGLEPGTRVTKGAALFERLD